MIELIGILCMILLILNTLWLLSPCRVPYDSGSDYTTKLVYSRGEGKDAWGQGQVLIVPKNRGSTKVKT